MNINADDCSTVAAKIVFDTNIWISIEGLNGNSKLHLQKSYSGLLARLQSSGCKILTNNYVIGEFYNRCCKMQYESAKKSSSDPSVFPYFKEYRKTEEGLSDGEYAKDMCVQIISDCEFEFVTVSSCMESIVEECSRGLMDINDIILREHCRENGYYLATHDADYNGCGLGIVTANRRMLIT